MKAKRMENDNWRVRLWHGSAGNLYYVIDTRLPSADGANVVPYSTYPNRSDAHAHATTLRKGGTVDPPD